MENVYYLASELPSYVNYPELQECGADIDTLMDYGMRAQSALADYNMGLYDRIDLNENELQDTITLCRDVCYKLGTATNICFDILTQLRSLQMELQNLLYLKRDFGSTYVGTPTDLATTEDGGAF